MDGIIHEQTTLDELVRNEVYLYSGTLFGTKQYAVNDSEQRTYLVVTVPDNSQERPAHVAVMVRIIGDMIVIDEDTAWAEPLYEVLMSKGIPREKIVLAYEGEPIPDAK